MTSQMVTMEFSFSELSIGSADQVWNEGGNPDGSHPSNRNEKSDGGKVSLTTPLTDLMRHKKQAAAHYNTARDLLTNGNYVGAKSSLLNAVASLDDDLATKPIARAVYQIHQDLGLCCFKIGQYEDAIAAYEKALEIATDFALNAKHIAATKRCIGTLVLHTSNLPSSVDKAIHHFQSAFTLSEEVHGPESIEVASISNNLGLAYYKKADHAQALSAYNKAYWIRRTVLSPDSREVAASMCNVAQAYHLCGDVDNAMKLYLEFLDVAKASNKYPSDVASISVCVADVHKQRNDCVAAKQWYAEALSAAKLVHGEMHMEVASIHFKTAQLHFQQEDYCEALDHFMNGLKIEQTVLSWNDPQIVLALLNIARTHCKLGNAADAMIAYCQIHSIQLATNGGSSLEVAGTLCSMGLLQYEQKNYGSAYDLLLQALQIQQAHYQNDENSEVVSTLSSIGLVLFHQGVLDLASRCFSDSLRIRRVIYGSNHRDNAILCYNLATIALESGDDEAAIEFYKEALRVELCSGDHTTADVILTLQHIAIVHQRRGEWETALLYFSEALHYERNAAKADTAAIIRLLNAIGNLHQQLEQVVSMMEAYSEASRLALTLGAPDSHVESMGGRSYDLSKLHPPCAPVA